MSSNIWNLTVDNGHFVEATSVKLVVIDLGTLIVIKKTMWPIFGWKGKSQTTPMKRNMKNISQTTSSEQIAGKNSESK